MAASSRESSLHGLLSCARACRREVGDEGGELWSMAPSLRARRNVVAEDDECIWRFASERAGAKHKGRAK